MRSRISLYLLLALLFYVTTFLFTLDTWVLGIFQVGVLGLAWTVAWRGTRRFADLPAKPLLLITAAAVLWISLQLALGTTVYSKVTVDLLLYWVTALCLIFLGAQLGQSRSDARLLLKAMVWFTVVMAMIGVLSFYTAGGKYYWLIPSEYPFVVGPFAYRNYFAILVELILPITLYFAFRERRNWAFYAAAVAIMYGTVLATGSRSGTGLLTVELLVLLFLIPTRGLSRGKGFGSVFARVLLLIAAFTVISGYELILQRFQMEDPYVTRREFLLSSIEMVKDRPLWGFGLGTWTIAYPAYAIIDTGLFANHAHNEWIQWAAEGGIPFVILMAAIPILSIRPAFRTVWGIGILAVYAHAWVDYPFYRLGLAAWTFVLLGILHSYDPSGDDDSRRHSAGMEE